MNRAELIDAVAEATNMKKVDAARAVDATFDAITSALKAGEDVKLPGFGAFDVATREARTGRNPANGAVIQIPATKQVKFKALKGLKDAVNA